VRKGLFVGGVIAVALSVVAAGCGGGGSKTSSGGGGGATALPSSSCADIYYTGSGKPDHIIASDLPLQGSGRTQTVQMTQAIKFVLKQNSFTAGKYKIGYQSCDDSTAQAGKWDSGKCAANAKAYASDSSVLGVIGTFNSGCAEIIIPVLNRANPGPLGMVSPANTYVGLTHGGPGTAPGEPAKYYPTGKRSYIRIVAADDFQGAADALYAQQSGVKSLFILNDKEAYGLGVATDFKNATTKLKIKIAGFTAWDPKASSYEALATKIKQSGADAVFLGGLICENGGKLVKDLRAGLGKTIKLMAPDGFTPISAVVSGAGAPNANGMSVSVAGQPNEALPAAGKKFVKDFGATIGGQNPDPYAAYAAQSMQVLLDAIKASDGSRASVTDMLLKTKVTNGILGTFTINANGDTSSNPVTVYGIANAQQTTIKTIVPPQSLVAAS
jgi:branched-chain amino acid transport system substrate-binding protein